MKRLGLILCAAMVATGCDENKQQAANPAPSATPSASAPAATASAGGAVTDADRAQAKEIFASRCTPCHGPSGKGDGPASAGLTPKPRNLQDPAWQKAVTDAHIETVISYGGAAVGKSAAMPPNPDLAEKPVVKALREHIRNLE